MTDEGDDRPGPGSTALVTGSTSGIGREIARQLLDAGLRVLVAGRSAERARATAAELGDGAEPLQLDVTDAASIAAATQRVERLDVLVNNAGVNPGVEPLGPDSAEQMARAYATNVIGLTAVTAAFLPALRRSAHPRIVNLGSGTGSLTWSSHDNPQFEWRNRGSGIAYRSSKAAVNMVTLLTAQAEEGVLVNVLAPGLRQTNLIPGMTRGGDPAEAAAGAVRLALLPDDGPTGGFFSWDGTPAPW